MTDKFKALQLSGEELSDFIGKLVEKLYDQVWAGAAAGPDETAVKRRLESSIIEALKEYAGYQSDS